LPLLRFAAMTPPAKRRKAQTPSTPQTTVDRIPIFHQYFICDRFDFDYEVKNFANRK
jgi:hypothetical protein